MAFESSFGCTEAIAAAIAEGLSQRMEVTVLDVRTAPHCIPSDVDLVVAGGPTHAFGLSREETRRKALAEGARLTHSLRFGLRDWLAVLRTEDDRPWFAAFDTRFRRWWARGSAARAADRRLARAHLRRLARPKSFSVADTPGPLLAGELEAARAWGDRLGRELAQRTGLEPGCDLPGEHR